jgi:Family of unknown function (DUF6289)
MLQNILKRRIFLAIVMASMLFGAAFLTTFTCRPASARGCASFTMYYYSDPTWSTVIGYYHRPCEGLPYSWGSTSEYKNLEEHDCGC